MRPMVASLKIEYKGVLCLCPSSCTPALLRMGTGRLRALRALLRVDTAPAPAHHRHSALRTNAGTTVGVGSGLSQKDRIRFAEDPSLIIGKQVSAHRACRFAVLYRGFGRRVIGIMYITIDWWVAFANNETPAPSAAHGRSLYSSLASPTTARPARGRCGSRPSSSSTKTAATCEGRRVRQTSSMDPHPSTTGSARSGEKAAAIRCRFRIRAFAARAARRSRQITLSGRHV